MKKPEEEASGVGRIRRRCHHRRRTTFPARLSQRADSSRRLPVEVLDQMKAPPKDPEIPEITAVELAEADGVLFGFPTRYGCMAAQMKAFFDSTGQLWKEQKLAGKPAGFFVSTGTQGGFICICP